MLTQVEQIIEKEKEDLLVANTKSVTQSVKDMIARNLLNSGSSPDYVATNTGLSLQEVQKLMRSN